MPREREKLFSLLQTPKCVRSILCGPKKSNIIETARLFRVRIDCPSRRDGSEVPFIIIGDTDESINSAIDHLRNILDEKFGVDEWRSYQ